jgi:Domain of unknown function (DUF1707)
LNVVPYWLVSVAPAVCHKNAASRAKPSPASTASRVFTMLVRAVLISAEINMNIDSITMVWSEDNPAGVRTGGHRLKAELDHQRHPVGGSSKRQQPYCPRMAAMAGHLLRAVTRHIVSASAPWTSRNGRGVLVVRYGVAAVADADREAAAAQLREHYAAGRLSLDEFQDRLDAVYRAQTVRELGMVGPGPEPVSRR